MLNTKNFEYYINEFSNYMLLERNLSINTINSYKNDIFQLENYVLIKFKNKINIEDILSKEIFEKYKVDQKLIDLAGDEIIILHCLPAHRGEEISDEALESKNSSIFDQAENRLHVQQALLAVQLGGL